MSGCYIRGTQPLDGTFLLISVSGPAGRSEETDSCADRGTTVDVLRLAVLFLLDPRRVNTVVHKLCLGCCLSALQPLKCHPYRLA